MTIVAVLDTLGRFVGVEDVPGRRWAIGSSSRQTLTCRTTAPIGGTSRPGLS